ncbi:MAG TPA: DUF2066 domain-containing protein [Marinobacter sp.]|nr:DUF2066 domain-containing protein [Marinobacter sp.]
MTDSGLSRTISLLNTLVFAAVMVVTLVSSGTASAATVPGLYSVDVPVESSSASDLAAGYAEGLSQILVRVSGTREVLAKDGVDGIVADAESLLLSYQVRREDGKSRLQMNFGAVGVNRALAAIGAPVWGANRPLTLAWIAVQEGGNRNLLTIVPEDTAAGDAPTATDVWSRAFAEASAARGLPITFPPQSVIEDSVLLSDLWGLFVDRIQQASDGLYHDVLALMRISRSDGQWRAGWVFRGMGMDASEQVVTAESPEALANAVIDQWVELYSSRYAVAAEDAGGAPRVDIVLEGVSTIADYGQVTRALAGFTPVTSVGATRVSDGRLTVEVAFNGEVNQLKEYIALDARFVPMTPTVVGSGRSGSADATLMMNDSRVPAAGSTDSSQGSDGGADEGGRLPVGETSQGPFVYQPLLAENEKDAEQAFESLYPVLYYRWQPATVIETPGDR